MTHTLRTLSFTSLLLALGACSSSRHESLAPQDPAPAAPIIDCEKPVACDVGMWATAVDPKPIQAYTRRGLAWLLATQHEDGGWGQGEESAQMRGEGNTNNPSNVADTCIAMLALLRASATPGSGEFAPALRRAGAFVCRSIEASDEASIFVTELRNTRVQLKIGSTVDTFLASLALAELKGRSGDNPLDVRVAANLQKVVNKIARNQQADGAFEGQGWAPVLSQGLAGKALNRSRQSGAALDDAVLVGNQAFFVAMGENDAPAVGAAGVDLYASSASLAGLQEHANSDVAREAELERVLAESKDEHELDDARKGIARIALGRKAQEQVRGEVVARLGDEGFVTGFGSNGGEEFLSYMNISESLVMQGGNDWTRWDTGMAQNLERIQNQDGSWSGHHCITGRNFCTAAALLVLLADRTPVPAELVAKR